jgi:porin
MAIKHISFPCAILLVCTLLLTFKAIPTEAQQNDGALIVAASAPAQLGAANRVAPASSAIGASLDSAEASRVNERYSGTRELLEARGITLGVSYKGEVLGSLLRGREAMHDVTLLGSGLSSLDLDLTKMHVYRGHVSMNAQTLFGTGLNESLMGSAQLPSNLDAAQYTKLMEAWYGDSYLKDRLDFKIGRLYADGDFGTIEDGGDFLNASYGALPTSPMPTYPDPALGIAASGTPSSWLSLGAGVYRGNNLSPLDEDGLEQRKGLFMLGEARFKPQTIGALHHAAFRAGAWHQSHGTWMSDAVAGATPVGNYGVYAVADYRFGADSEEEGRPAVFARWGWAPSDRNEISNYWSGGITYPGLNLQRRHDAVGLGIAQVTLPECKRETVVELFYKLQISKRIMVQPDVQWARNPSGTGANQAVAGLRLGVSY